ncbi:arylsulfatase B-like isoform X2 [Malaya genurostris]|uniref:arylsulfatase B-like isoform X2 n=1 Tax=Malaya genurostris TaxID=325434 RepID=UPI0026F3B5D1|nr:arylsulfatase B-like isoform X2 [Malaya genurostris]
MRSVRVTITVCVILAVIPLVLNASISANGGIRRPHIVIILADDMGWNDVGFHGSNQIPTPNIDALAYSGIILNRHYSGPMCTPSRSALMTGRNPINIGMQHYVIVSDEPWGLGLDQKTMAEYFKEAGYKTHLVGKWHLGFFAEQYTPLMRGFDSHVGFLGPYIDYWNYTLKMLESTQFEGYDMRRNATVDHSFKGTYATDHFTNSASSIIKQHNPEKPLFLMVNHLAPHAGNEDDPLQAPEETLKRMEHISDMNRRTYAAMVSKLDDSVGEIFKTLQSKNMLENSIILVMSDNGAPTVGQHANTGSNYPLKGQKNTPWEGSTRTFAALWSPLLREQQRVSNQFVHISDWLPTLASAAGIDVPQAGLYTEIDGIDQWEALSYDTGNPRRVVLNMIDEIFGYSSYMEKGFKYVNGSTSKGKRDDWYGNLNTNDTLPSDDEYFEKIQQTEIAKWSGQSLSKDVMNNLRKHARINCGNPAQVINKCRPLIRPCLFDIINDPCELNDISRRHYQKMSEMHDKVNTYRQMAVKPRNKPHDPASNPAYHNGIWTWWQKVSFSEELQPPHSTDDEGYRDLDIPPPHSSLPEDIRLPVIISIVVIGILFVISALIYLSNKNLLRFCKNDNQTEKHSVSSTTANRPKSVFTSDSSSDEKLSDGYGNSSSTNITAKSYHIKETQIEKY